MEAVDYTRDPYSLANPDYEENIRKLAAKMPNHPKVQEYRQMFADGLDEEDIEWCRKMLALAEEGNAESDDPDLTAEDIAWAEEAYRMAEGFAG